MQAQSGIKFRRYPSGEQIPVYSRQIGHQRFIYNGKVDEDREFRTFLNHALSLTGQRTPIDQQYSQFKDKDLTAFLYEVPSQILRNGAYRYMQGYNEVPSGRRSAGHKQETRPAERPDHQRTV